MRGVGIIWIIALLVVPALAEAMEPVEVVALAQRLDSGRLDTARSLAATGQQLHRPGIDLTFSQGRFVPIVREDGRVSGLVFEGFGSVRVAIPEGDETRSWMQSTQNAPLEQDFDAAWLHFSDETLLELQGEQELQEDSDPSGTTFRLHEARQALLTNKTWTRNAPHLLTDQLVQLLGGDDHGHLLADLRTTGESGWLSYLHNPRGALFPNETTALYQAVPRGGSPPEVEVHASWGQGPDAQKRFDVANITVDVEFPTRGRANANMVEAKVRAELEVVNIQPDRTLKALIFELASERLLCTEQPDRTQIDIDSVRDELGNKLAGIHRHGRLVVPLERPLKPGEAMTLTIAYSGPMTQGIPAARPDIYFSELGPWAWYPRNLHDDRFGSRVQLHLPLFMRGVAPGDLVEEVEGKDGWHFTYVEPSGVKNLTVVVGDLVKSPDKEQGSDPRIIVWTGSTEQELVRGAAQGARGLVEFVEGIWGKYPYSTLHVVENAPYPALNWEVSSEGEGGAWSCVPPGQVHPWQGMVEGPSGMLLSTSRTTAPAREIMEARAITRLLTDPIESGTHLRIADLTRQWWGHMVPARSYRDAWIGEAFSHWTALLWVQAGVGRMALKQRVQSMHALMVEEAEFAHSLVLGARLGRRFPAQAWGRGPLIINWLVDRVESRPLMNALSRLINEASGRGVTASMLVESVRGADGDGTAGMLERAILSNHLPELEYGAAIDKETGEVCVVLRQTGRPRDVDVRIEVMAGPKKREQRTVRVGPDGASIRWIPGIAAKKVQVDPLRSAIARSIKRVKPLSDEAAAQLKDVEQDESGSQE